MSIINIFKLFGSVVLNDEASGALDKLEGKADSTSRSVTGKLGDIGDKMESMGKNATKKITAPIVAMGTGAVMAYASFDDQMREVSSTMGNNLGGTIKEQETNMKRLTEEAKNLGATTAFSAGEAGAAMKNFAQMGYDTEQVLASTGTALAVASATGLELDYVAGTLAGTMNQFGVEADSTGENIGRFGDVLTRAGQISGTSMDEIAEALKNVGSDASNAGMDIEQTSAFIGAMGDQMISSGSAGTSMSAIFRDMKAKVDDGVLSFGEFDVAMYDSNGEMRDMIDIVEDMEDGLEGMSDEQRDAALSSIFGSTAQKGLNGILNAGSDQLREYESELKNADGTAQTASDNMEGGIGGSFRELGSSISALAVEFGETLAPTVEKVADFVSKAASKFAGMDERTKKVIVTIAAIAAVIGPVLLIVGKVISAVSVIGGALAKLGGVIKLLGAAFAFLTSPIGLVIAAIAAVIAIGVALYKNWDTISEYATAAWDKIKEIISSTIEWLGDFISNSIEFWKTIFSNGWNFIKDIFSSIIENIKLIIIGFFEIVVNLITMYMEMWSTITETVLNVIKSIFSTVMDFIKNIITNAFNLIKNIISTVMNTIKTVISTIWNGIKTTISNIVEGIKNTISSIFESIKTIITNIFNGIKSVATNVWNGIKTTISNIVEGIRTNVSSIFEKIKSVIENVSNGIKSVVTTIFNGVKDAILKPIRSARDTVGKIVDSIKGFFNNMKLSIPEIKLPRLPKPSIEGSFSMTPPSVPKISWNAKGGIFKKPTIFDTPNGLQGVGEAGAEAIIPLSNLRDWMNEWFKGDSGDSNKEHVVNPERSINLLTEALASKERKPKKTTELSEPTYNLTFNIEGDWTVDSDERQESVVEEFTKEIEKYLRDRGLK